MLIEAPALEWGQARTRGSAQPRPGRSLFFSSDEQRWNSEGCCDGDSSFRNFWFSLPLPTVRFAIFGFRAASNQFVSQFVIQAAASGRPTFRGRREKPDPSPSTPPSPTPLGSG